MLVICVFQTILFGEYKILTKKNSALPSRQNYVPENDGSFFFPVWFFFLTLHETPTKKKKKFLASRDFVFVDKT